MIKIFKLKLLLFLYTYFKKLERVIGNKIKFDDKKNFNVIFYVLNFVV